MRYMRFPLLALLPATSLALPVERSTSSSNTTAPVCIVGAGPSGLTAARQLEDKGYSTIIFEKQSLVGGKCQSYYDDHTFHPLGALLYSNATYVETLKVIEEVGVSSQPFPGQSAALRWDYNWETGATSPTPPITAGFAGALQIEIPRYAYLWQTQFLPYGGIGYKNGVPAPLTVSMAQWLSTNNFTALPVLVVQATSLYGYGDYRQVPALYVLQYLTPDIITYFAGQHNGYLIDFHEVFVRYSKTIEGPIVLNAAIEKIDRTGASPTISYHIQPNGTTESAGWIDQDGTKSLTQQCSSVILAFPPTISNLNAANLALSPQEQSTFGPLGTNTYYSGNVRLQTPYGIVFRTEGPSPVLPPVSAGEPVQFLRLSNESDVTTTYSWGPYRGDLTYDQAKTLLTTVLSRVNKDPRNVTAVSQPVTDADVIDFRSWDYFPHFDPAELAHGWYDKFNALQGGQQTFYTSGVNGFDTVEFVLRAAMDIVDTYY